MHEDKEKLEIMQEIQEYLLEHLHMQAAGRHDAITAQDLKDLCQAFSTLSIPIIVNIGTPPAMLGSVGFGGLEA